jgi:hypothetical protein
MASSAAHRERRVGVVLVGDSRVGGVGRHARGARVDHVLEALAHARLGPRDFFRLAAQRFARQRWRALHQALGEQHDHALREDGIALGLDRKPDQRVRLVLSVGERDADHSGS